MSRFRENPFHTALPRSTRDVQVDTSFGDWDNRNGLDFLRSQTTATHFGFLEELSLLGTPLFCGTSGQVL